MKQITKLKLKYLDILGTGPAYKIISITGNLWVSTSKGNFRAGDTMPETAARELTDNHRDYLVTIIA